MVTAVLVTCASSNTLGGAGRAGAGKCKRLSRLSAKTGKHRYVAHTLPCFQKLCMSVVCLIDFDTKCYDFLQGSCRYGSTCKFQHVGQSGQDGKGGQLGQGWQGWQGWQGGQGGQGGQGEGRQRQAPGQGFYGQAATAYRSHHPVLQAAATSRPAVPSLTSARRRGGQQSVTNGVRNPFALLDEDEE